MLLKCIGPEVIAPVDTAEEAKGKRKKQSRLGVKSVGHAFVVLKFKFLDYSMIKHNLTIAACSSLSNVLLISRSSTDNEWACCLLNASRFEGDSRFRASKVQTKLT